MECGIAQALELIGDPWSILIIREALFGTKTFDTFQRHLGIAKNTLTDRLSHLVDVGILARMEDEQDGRRVIYELEEAGEELLTVLLALSQWGNKWAFAEDGPPSFVADKKTGKPVAPLKVSGASGRQLGLQDVTMVPGPSASKKLRTFFAALPR